VVSDFKFRLAYLHPGPGHQRPGQPELRRLASSELKKSYLTFLGKPIFVNHHQRGSQEGPGPGDRVALRRGRCRQVHRRHPGDRRHAVPEIGSRTHPRRHGLRLDGCGGRITICSVCDNRATDVFDMCGHIKFHKGEHMRNQKTGERTLVYEKCHKLASSSSPTSSTRPTRPRWSRA